MPDKQTHVIVGAALAGAKAAEALREEGFDGRVVLVGTEDERPYERPPLSKDYVRGEADAKPYVHDESFYSENEIELRTSTTVERIDPGASEVSLAGGETLRFDRLLLATGAEPRRLRLPGADLEGVLYLRTIEDSEAIRERIDAGGRLVTIGAGWIGAEVAASAKQRGCEVTILATGQLPLERVLGPELGRVYRDIHAEHGVEFVGGASVEAIEGNRGVAAVRLAGDRRIAADFVVVGVGVAPRTGLAEAAGLESTTGSRSTSTCVPAQTTSTPPATWPAPVTRSTRGASGSSTGPTPSTRGRPLRATCSAARSPTTASRTSSRTSTTSAWSTRALRATGTRSSSAAIRRAASSSRSGSRTAVSSPG
jgi:3-phenylpropionate/trans-cinnamate dioxygenase ferredoxin reductase component